eukprot:gnl/TRDRNA2_/TRDRNA2_135524_c0_seq1.p2 gnl/TRDRNA2_/TRDRNA2_135524_c0~~gnl/TRDRNA2_/TRDRNA2_135524_c0_seq1.p2  ORF type:complete len:192 (+),score=65.81 gnl/TRDRNA2_/TRDRNA2_135524_c0_seq1:119-694(+)
MILGTAMFPTGIFLVTNADLIVTYFRLQAEVRRFAANNAAFEENLDEQAKEVRKLQTAAKAFKELDAKFGGDVNRATKELGKLEATMRDNMTQSCRTLCALYCDADRDRLLDLGEELDKFLEVLTQVFGAICDDFDKRATKIKEGITANAGVQAKGGLAVNKIGGVVAQALHESDINKIPAAVQQVLSDDS